MLHVQIRVIKFCILKYSLRHELLNATVKLCTINIINLSKKFIYSLGFTVLSRSLNKSCKFEIIILINLMKFLNQANDDNLFVL